MKIWLSSSLFVFTVTFFGWRFVTKVKLHFWRQHIQFSTFCEYQYDLFQDENYSNKFQIILSILAKTTKNMKEGLF